MSYLFLIPVSIGIGAIFLGAFFWNLRSGQYEDLDGAAARILTPNTAPHAPHQNPARSEAGTDQNS
jgi:cbb3-type cytochrome oxidase maturation protein